MLNRFSTGPSSFQITARGAPRRRWALIAAAWFCITGGAVLAGSPPVLQYASSSDSGQATVSGTSTLHDWTVTSHVIKGNAAFSGDWKIGSAPPVSLQSIDLVVPVSSLKSTEGSGMDNTMYEALKVKQFPEITFRLTAGSLKSSPSQPGGVYHFGANGELGVAGTKHPVGLDLAVTPHDDGRLTIATDVGVKMTDCGVTPPTAMLGAIKSGNVITVKVTWELARQPAGSQK